MKYDVIIIDSLITYQNIAFDFGIVNLRINDEVMALPNLIQHYYPEKVQAFAKRALNLEECGKLNGIFLYDYLKKSGFKCALVSNVLENEQYLENLLSEGTRAVIISTTWTIGAGEVKKATQLIRNLDVKVPVIVGGVLVFNSYLVFQQIDNEDFDHRSIESMYFFVNQDPELYEDIDIFIIDRCGVKTLTKVLKAIKTEEDFRGLNNIAYYRNSELVINPLSPEKIDLNDQVISWNEIESEYIPEILPVQLSLGCNFGCKFCNFFNKRHCYTKLKDNIRRELNWIRSRSKVKMIRFVDDSMPARVLHDLCEIMIEDDIDIPWTTFIRLDALAREDFSLIQKANCIDVQVGIESGDNRILRNMDKKITSDKYLQILDVLSELDISIRASFILGYPGENRDSITNTIAFLNRLPTDRNATFYVGFAPFILLPLSPIYYESERRVFQLRGCLIDWQHESMSFADIPEYLRKIFLSVKDEVLFAYTADPMDKGLPKDILKKIKIIRQRCQKEILRGLPESKIDTLKADLKASLEKLQQSI
jgi:anaerobic magnesium-protoporphyrin IX monomethyl ester cyclase